MEDKYCIGKNSIYCRLWYYVKSLYTEKGLILLCNNIR